MNIEEAIRRIDLHDASPEKKDEWKNIVHFYAEFQNQHEVSKILGIRQGQISRVLRRFGIHIGRGARSVIHKLPMADVVRQYKDGMSTIDLGRLYGVDPEVIRRRMIRHDKTLQMRGAGNASGAKNSQWKGGKSQIEWSDCRKFARRIAEFCLSRRLESDEVVHHHDEVPANNHPSNLWVFPSPQSHLRYHQQLIKSRYAICSEEANLLALESGGLRLPIPFDLTPLSLDKDQLSPYKKMAILEKHLVESGILPPKK
jgi:hypothetical protein